MSRNVQRIELYLAFFMGMKPADMIKRGIPKATVYQYSHRFKARRMKERYLELLALPIKENKGGREHEKKMREM